MSNYIDFDLFSSFFSYDKEAGELKRKVKVNQYGVGSLVGSKHICGAKNSQKTYYRFKFRGCFYYVHRVLWVLVTNEQPEEIDHIDGDGLNNKWGNLRSISHSVNGKNQKKHKNNTSGNSGVTFRKDSNKWRARIMVNDKSISLGTFASKEDAVTARQEGEVKYW